MLGVGVFAFCLAVVTLFGLAKAPHPLSIVQRGDGHYYSLYDETEEPGSYFSAFFALTSPDEYIEVINSRVNRGRARRFIGKRIGRVTKLSFRDDHGHAAKVGGVESTVVVLKFNSPEWESETDDQRTVFARLTLTDQLGRKHRTTAKFTVGQS
jgi:hypothetical protein